MNQRQADLFDALCKDPSTCIANAYFFARDGEGHPQIDWMCRQDLADTGSCFCGRLTAQSDDDVIIGQFDSGWLAFACIYAHNQQVVYHGDQSDGLEGADG